jgi:hypothetical protein
MKVTIFVFLDERVIIYRLFLPVLLSVLLDILIQRVDKNLKCVLPLYVLGRANEAI